MKNVMEASTWITVESCPACGGEDSSPPKALAIEEYHFGDERIPLPQGGIGISECSNCGLAFKNMLPSPQFLAKVLCRQKGRVWAGNYEFSDEAELLRSIVGDRNFDLLDIGASNGGLLKAFSHSGGRRSALDVVRHPGIEEWLRGEFIDGLAESKEFSWSGKPYDVISMFDIAEHFYNPEQAFYNLRTLVKSGGFIVLETGDVQSYWPQRFGIHKWWYACRFEHHVFWSKECLERVAKKHGLRVVECRRKRHKMRSLVPLKRDFVNSMKSLSYHFEPDWYVRFARKLGKSGSQPWGPFTKDHFRVVLRSN